jgi:hypothetical protein
MFQSIASNAKGLKLRFWNYVEMININNTIFALRMLVNVFAARKDF